MKRLDLIEELEKIKEARTNEEKGLLRLATQIFANESLIEADISNRLVRPKNQTETILDTTLLDEKNIYKTSEIASIASKFRLRFLSSALYKDEIPLEATFKIKELENKHNIKFQEFKILAPSSKFSLKDSKEDPLLFAALDNDNYYFIHKWGNDFTWFRKIVSYPFQNIKNLGVSSIILGLIIAFLAPDRLLPVTEWQSPFVSTLATIYFSFICSGFIFVSSLIFGILSEKEFSEDVWNSKYFN